MYFKYTFTAGNEGFFLLLFWQAQPVIIFYAVRVLCMRCLYTYVSWHSRSILVVGLLDAIGLWDQLPVTWSECNQSDHNLTDHRTHIPELLSNPGPAITSTCEPLVANHPQMGHSPDLASFKWMNFDLPIVPVLKSQKNRNELIFISRVQSEPVWLWQSIGTYLSYAAQIPLKRT